METPLANLAVDATAGTDSAQTPVRRLTRWRRVGQDSVDELAVSVLCPNTRKNPRLRSTKAPLNAEFTGSTTCRRPIEILHAVVPKGIR